MAESDAFYQELANEARDIIVEYGKLFVVEQEGITDLASLTVSDGSQRNVWGIVSDGEHTSIAETGGVVWTAKKTLMLAYDAEPQEGEKVIVDGVKYSLSKLTPIKPADVTVVYLLDIG